ncbi:glycosyltransferase [Methylobacterium isbiliense]|uniref:4'-demethylrebeccamycin synthase n=1 Tax=Methylobacterium isbiliense TaxID=315478 RepID=A0ABQ4SEI8_9HYPH|nr:glycosyltransferase [Methylobacterium isbiliense]MDN3622379.1 glycosyltransferase [Methylobacterium isbiliense]GJE01590.1 4'-demethylrebeccamycin synthase [Methylobacterium isbiliense]
MKLLIAATPLTGHLNPLLAIARAALARGDQVAVTTASAFRDRVEAEGLRCLPYEDDHAAEYRATELPAGPERYRREFERRFIDGIPSQAEWLRGLIARERPDALVAGSLVLGVLPLLLGAGPRPPVVTCNVSFLFLDRPDGAPVGPGLPPARDAAERARYAAIRAQVEAAFTQPVRAYTDAALARAGAPGLPASLTHAILTLPDALVQFTTPAFEYDFSPLPPSIRFVGALPPPAQAAPRPDWWGDLAGGRRIVLVTQGTLANADFDELVAPTLAALAGREDVLVLGTTGGRPLDAVRGPIPANARLATFLPFADLMPRLSALVTNGGYGTVQAALQAGVPILSAGLTEDKAEIGARVGWSGAGLNLATNTPSPGEIRRSVDALLDDPSFRLRARALAADFARHDPLAETLAVIDEAVRAGWR